MIQRWTYCFPTSLQPVQIYLDSPLDPFYVCFHFQWPVSCTRNIFTITEQPPTFSHVFGDRRSKQNFWRLFFKNCPWQHCHIFAYIKRTMPALLFQPLVSASCYFKISQWSLSANWQIWGYGSKMIIPPSGSSGDSEQGNVLVDRRFWGWMSLFLAAENL